MNFTRLRRLMPGLLDSGISLELRSPPGRGKSEFVADTIDVMSARDANPDAPDKGVWGFTSLFLATQTPPDLLGYMFKGSMDYTDHSGMKHTISITDPTMPPWMVTSCGKPVQHFKRGILFLDEFGQGQQDVKAAAAELLLNKRLGKWELPRGWTVIAASNRTQDRSGVTKSLDFVINRREEIDITDDLQSWEDWAFKKGVEPLFISFANQNPNVVFSEGVPEKQGPWCTPRSLVMCSRLLENLRDDEGRVSTDGDAMEVASGMIGQAATAALFAHVKLGHELPSIDDIIKNPKTTKVTTKPDAGILITYNLAARINEKNASPVITYMERMPKEFAVTFAKAACRRDPTLVYHPAFLDWSDKNASLMTALTDHK
jgi:hypothetical protein